MRPSIALPFGTSTEAISEVSNFVRGYMGRNHRFDCCLTKQNRFKTSLNRLNLTMPIYVKKLNDIYKNDHIHNWTFLRFLKIGSMSFFVQYAYGLIFNFPNKCQNCIYYYSFMLLKFIKKFIHILNLEFRLHGSDIMILR